jgi:hypothetical protein
MTCNRIVTLLTEPSSDTHFHVATSVNVDNHFGFPRLKSLNIGEAKDIIKIARQSRFRHVILVADAMSSHASNHFFGSGVFVERFTYGDATSRIVTKHAFQPRRLRKLCGSELVEFKRDYPNFAREVKQYSTTDALIRVFGFRANDVIQVDGVPGLVVDDVSLD